MHMNIKFITQTLLFFLTVNNNVCILRKTAKLQTWLPNIKSSRLTKRQMSATIKSVCTTVYFQLSYILITDICTALVTVSGTPYILLNLSMLLLINNISYTDVEYIKLR